MRIILGPTLLLFASCCAPQPETSEDLRAMLDQAVEECGFDAMILGAGAPTRITIGDISHFRGLQVEEGRRLRCVLDKVEHVDHLEVEFRREVVDFESFRTQLPEFES